MIWIKVAPFLLVMGLAVQSEKKGEGEGEKRGGREGGGETLASKKEHYRWYLLIFWDFEVAQERSTRYSEILGGQGGRGDGAK